MLALYVVGLAWRGGCILRGADKKKKAKEAAL